MKEENGDSKNDDEEEESKPEELDEANDQSGEGDEKMDAEESDNEENLAANKPKKREKRDPVPKNWLFRGARKLFKEPNVLVGQFTEADLKFKDIDEAGLIKFLCEENGFNEDRIRPAIERVKKAKGKTNQSRIDSFFKVIPQENKPKPAAQASSKKRSSSGANSGNKRGKK